MRENAIKDHRPDVAQHNATDEVGHEEDRAVQVGPADTLREGIGHRKGKDVDEHEAHHGGGCGVPERVLEAWVGQCRLVVGDSDEGGVRGDAELAERQIDTLDERPDEPDREGSHHRSQKEPRPTSGGLRLRVASADLLAHARSSFLWECSGAIGTQGRMWSSPPPWRTMRGSLATCVCEPIWAGVVSCNPGPKMRRHDLRRWPSCTGWPSHRRKRSGRLPRSCQTDWRCRR